MEVADDHRSVNLVSRLKLDLVTVKRNHQSERHDESSLSLRQGVKSTYSSRARHEVFRNKSSLNGANVTSPAEGPAVELEHTVALDPQQTGSGGSGLYQLPHDTEDASFSAVINHTSTHAEDNNVSNDSWRCSSSSALHNAVNNNTNNKSPSADKSKRQTSEVIPPNSSPARLGGPPRKSALSPLQKIEPRTGARGAALAVKGRKASSFSASTGSPVKSRAVKEITAVDTIAAGAVGVTSEKGLNLEGLAKYDGRAEGSAAGGTTPSSGASTHHLDKRQEQREDAEAVQQGIPKELSKTSDESEEGEDDDGQSESGDTDSCDADCQDPSPSECHWERDDEWQRQETNDSYPAVVETEIDGPEEEDHLDVGELRYNMRTGKFSKAYVVRRAGGHRTFRTERRTIAGGDKGTETSWIFPWEVRPDIDVFAAAAAATAASSATQQHLFPARRAGSAPANSTSACCSSNPAIACGKRFVEGLHRRNQLHSAQFQGRETDEEKRDDRIVRERQRESVFDCLSKMAQANEWAQMMKLDRNYRAFKTRDGKLAYHVYQGKSYVKRLPMEVFMSYEYPRLRRRFMLRCPYLHPQSQALTSANLNDTEVRTRRELELQNVLLSTIQLTHALREQVDFLQRVSNEYPCTQLR